MAEMGEGVFGVEAAARHWFGVSAADLTADAGGAAGGDPAGAARPFAGRAGAFVRRRAASILDGAETIRRDGRADCFEDDAD